jgi:hypothetical protein
MKLQLQRIPPKWKEAAMAAPSKKPEANPKAEAAEKAEDGPLKVPEGQRNAYLASEAGRMRGQGFSVAQIRAALLPINDAVCDPPLEKSEVSEIARSIGKYSTKSRATIEPEPLRRPRKAAKPFPIQALPKAIHEVVLKLNNVVQAPIALCAQCLIATINLAVQALVDIEVDGRRHPISLFLITVGESGERKSTVEAIVSKPIRDYQTEEFKKYRRAVKKQQQAKRNKKETKEEKQEECIDGCLAVLEADSKRDSPINPIICFEEPTYEAIAKLIPDSRRFLGLSTDEGGRLLHGYAMNTENQVKTSAGLSEFWVGKPYTRVRSSEDIIYVDGYRFGMHIMVQPGIADLLYRNQALLDQGILSRILPVFPDSTMGTRAYRPINLLCDPDIQDFHDKIDRLIRTPLQYESDGSGRLCTRTIGISEDAKKEYVKFYNFVEKNLHKGGKFDKIKGFASKACENGLRLAATLQIFLNPKSRQVSKDSMKSAIDIIVHYLNEFIRLSRTDIVNPDIILAEELRDWIHRKQYEYLYPKLVYQFGPNGIREKKVALRLLNILQDHGWLVPVEGGMKIDGSHRRKVWTVIRAADAPR